MNDIVNERNAERQHGLKKLNRGAQHCIYFEASRKERGGGGMRKKPTSEVEEIISAVPVPQKRNDMQTKFSIISKENANKEKL